MIAHVVLFWGSYAVDSFRLAYNRKQPDPHYQAMLKYKEAPWWWYIILLVLSFFAGICLFKWLITVLLVTFFWSGLIVTFKGETTLPWWSYLIALVFGAFVTVCIDSRATSDNWIWNVSYYSRFQRFYSLVWVLVLQRINWWKWWRLLSILVDPLRISMCATLTPLLFP